MRLPFLPTGRLVRRNPGLEYWLQGAFELLGQKGRKRRVSGLPKVRHIALYSVLPLTPPDRAIGTFGLDGLKALATAVPDTQGDAPGSELVLGRVEVNRHKIFGCWRLAPSSPEHTRGLQLPEVWGATSNLNSVSLPIIGLRLLSSYSRTASTRKCFGA